LLEQAVHQRGLAVVNVRDDRDVSNVLHIVNDRPAHTLKIPPRQRSANGKGGKAGMRMMEICRQRSSHA
jgi:hypothetical protein